MKLPPMTSMQVPPLRQGLAAQPDGALVVAPDTGLIKRCELEKNTYIYTLVSFNYPLPKSETAK